MTVKVREILCNQVASHLRRKAEEKHGHKGDAGPGVGGQQGTGQHFIP
jgi:hypothetical protein